MTIDTSVAGEVDATDPAMPPGLRERSKARRRALIQRTALRLFAERGYDVATIADIAEAAEVAPRTVSGYFPNKADLATSVADEIAGRLAATFAARPDADLLTVLDLWLEEEGEVLDPELNELVYAMYETNPELRALGSAQVARTMQIARATLVGRLRLPEGHPMIDICQAALSGALSAYLAAIGRHSATTELRQAMTGFLAGLIAAAAQE